jgi:hypothetical protein
MKIQTITIIVLSVLLLVNNTKAQSSKCMSFKDKESGMWGFKNSETNEVVIPATYDLVACSRGEVFPVKKNGFWFMVNAKNEPLTPINKMKDAMMYYPLHGSEPIWWGKSTYANELLKEYGYINEQMYKINKNCDCVPEDFYLCPFYVNMDTSATPEYLKMMQLAHIKLTEHFDFTGAQYYYGLAKKLAPNNTFLDYYMGTVLNNLPSIFYVGKYNKINYGELENWYGEVNNSDTVSSMDKRLVIWMYNAISNDMEYQLTSTIEDIYWSSEDTDTLKYFTNAYTNQRAVDTVSRAYWDMRAVAYEYEFDGSRKEVKNEFKTLLKSPYKKAMSPSRMDLTLAPSGFIQNGIQGFGLAAQVSLRLISPPLLEVHYGLGYERYLKPEYHVNAFNFDLYMLNLGVFSGNQQRSFGFRPTLPLSIWLFQLEYGYQFIFGPNNNDLRGHRIGLKFNIPYYNITKDVNGFHFFGNEFYTK